MELVKNKQVRRVPVVNFASALNVRRAPQNMDRLEKKTVAEQEEG